MSCDSFGEEHIAIFFGGMRRRGDKEEVSEKERWNWWKRVERERESERARRKRIAEVEFYWPEILQKDQIVWHLKMHKSDSFDIDASLSVGSRMKDDKKEETHINISKSQTTDLFRLNTKLTVYSQLIRNPLISPSSSLPPLLPLIQVRFIGISQSPI